MLLISLFLGNLGSAFVEVLVRESEFGGDFVSLLPQSMLMTAEESKSGRNLTRTKVFGQGTCVRIQSISLIHRYIHVHVI